MFHSHMLLRIFTPFVVIRIFNITSLDTGCFSNYFQVINKRNEAMHSPTLSFTLDQLQDSLAVMMDFLRKILISLPAEKGYDSIKKEMEKTIDILKEV